MSCHERLNGVSIGLMGSDRRHSFCAAILPAWVIAHPPLIAAPRGDFLVPQARPSMTPPHLNSVPQMAPQTRSKNIVRCRYQPHSCPDNLTKEKGQKDRQEDKNHPIFCIAEREPFVIDSTALQRLSQSMWQVVHARDSTG